MDKLNFARIDGMEIFSVGKWNNKYFSKENLQAIVDTFNKVGNKVKPYLKLGHDDSQKLLQKDGYPSAGWISKLELVGEKLVAYAEDVPKVIADLINKKAYKRVSSEIYIDPEIEGEKYPFALKAVALLGGDTPAVSNLNDIVALYAQEDLNFSTFTVEQENLYFKERNDSMNDEEIKAKKAELDLELEKFKSEKTAFEAQKKELFALQKEAESIVETARIKEINEFTSKLVSDNKIVPAQVDTVKEILSYTGKQKELKFSNNSKTIDEVLREFLVSFSSLGLTEKKSKNVMPEKKETKVYTTEQRHEVIKKFMKDHDVDEYTAIQRLTAEKHEMYAVEEKEESEDN